MKKIDHCPCCGNMELYTGHMDAMSMGVHCHPRMNKGCGLSVSVGLPNTNKEGLTMKQLDKKCLDEAILRWNRRSN